MRSSWLAVFVAALLGCKSGPSPVVVDPAGGGGGGAGDAKAAPAWQPGPPQKVTTVEGITEYRLDNGMRVLLFPDESKDTVTVNVTYFVGSRHEGYGEAGMAHLLEHMLFKGSTSYPKLSSQLEDRGAFVNGTTWTDRTNYFETLKATWDNVEFAIRMEADRMVNSRISAEDLSSEFTVVRNEFEAGENNVVRVMLLRLMAVAYDWHGYGRSTIGNRSDIERVPVDRLRAFYEKYYQPDNAMLVVAGKFDADKTLALINETFGAIPKPARELPPTYTIEPVQDGERHVVLRRVGDVSFVGLAYHVVPAAHDDFVAVEALVTLLADEPSGRLYRELVETGLASSVTAFAFAWRDPGLLIVGAQVPAGKPAEPVLARMTEIVEGFAVKPVTDEEVARFRMKQKKGFKLFYADSQQVAINLSEAAALGDWRMLFVSRDRAEALKTDRVQRVALSFLKRSNRTSGLFLPTKEPDRAPAVDAPDVVALTEGYEGRGDMAKGEAFEATLANIEARTTRVELDGGMKLTMLPKETRGDAVKARLTLRYGDVKSLRGKRLPAGLLPDMLGRGTKTMSYQQVKDRFDELEAAVSFGGGPGAIVVNITTTNENLPEVLRLVATLVREPAFPAAEFEVVRKEQLTALEEGLTDPQARLGNWLVRAIAPYPKTDVRHTPTLEEQIAELKAARLRDVQQVHKTLLGASYSQLTIVGDFGADELRLLAGELFGAWKSPRPWARIPSEFHAVTPGAEVIDTPDKEMAIIFAGQPLRLRDDHADYPALVMFNFVWGGSGFSSRLMQRLREKEGLSYGAGSFLQASEWDESGFVGGFAILAPQNAAKGMTLLVEELETLLRDGVTAEALATAKQAYLDDFTRSLSDDGRVLGLLDAATYRGRTLAFLEQQHAAIGKLTPDDVKAAAARHIAPPSWVRVTAGDQKKAADNAGK